LAIILRATSFYGIAGRKEDADERLVQLGRDAREHLDQMDPPRLAVGATFGARSATQ
jgi:hypothetical protein